MSRYVCFQCPNPHPAWTRRCEWMNHTRKVHPKHFFRYKRIRFSLNKPISECCKNEKLYKKKILELLRVLRIENSEEYLSFRKSLDNLSGYQNTIDEARGNTSEALATKIAFQKSEEEKSYLLQAINSKNEKIFILESQLVDLKRQIGLLSASIKKMEESYVERKRIFDLLNPSYSRNLSNFEELGHYVNEMESKLVKCIRSMPRNSQVRKGLISFLFPSGSHRKRFVDKIIIGAGLNPRYLESVREEHQRYITQIRSQTHNTDRRRFPRATFLIFEVVLDEIIPFLSGADYRTREKTKNEVFEDYERVMIRDYTNIPYFGYHRFWEEIRARRIPVRYRPVRLGCLICIALRRREQNCVLTQREHRLINANPNHHEQIADCYRYMRNRKNFITQNRLLDHAQFVGDYSHHMTGNGSRYQDMIIVKYEFVLLQNGDGVDVPSIGATYHHFIREGQSRNKADKWGTMTTWIFIFEQNLFPGIRTFYNTSDGCGSQFKNTEVHVFWNVVQSKYDQVTKIDYDYLKSNHADNASDGGGSHTRQHIRRWEQRNPLNPIQDEYQLCEVINELHNHTAYVIPGFTGEGQSFEHDSDRHRIQSIRKKHGFLHNHNTRTISTWERSLDREGRPPDSVFQISENEWASMNEIVDEIIRFVRARINRENEMVDGENGD